MLLGSPVRGFDRTRIGDSWEVGGGERVALYLICVCYKHGTKDAMTDVQFGFCRLRSINPSTRLFNLDNRKIQKRLVSILSLRSARRTLKCLRTASVLYAVLALIALDYVRSENVSITMSLSYIGFRFCTNPPWTRTCARLYKRNLVGFKHRCTLDSRGASHMWVYDFYCTGRAPVLYNFKATQECVLNPQAREERCSIEYSLNLIRFLLLSF